MPEKEHTNSNYHKASHKNQKLSSFGVWWILLAGLGLLVFLLAVSFIPAKFQNVTNFLRLIC